MLQIRTLVDRGLEWVYPKRCELCARLGRPSICSECESDMVPHEPLVQKGIAGNPLDLTASLFAFEGRAAQAVKRLKYSRSTALASPLAQMMAEGLKRMPLPEFDVVVPVPIHWRRLYARGFNQAEMLCEELPEGIVQRTYLKRVRSTRPQVGLTREERLTNLKGAFEATADCRDLRILVIDDVTTTGGTAVACAEALKAVGAAKVGVLTICGGEDVQASGESSP